MNPCTIPNGFIRRCLRLSEREKHIWKTTKEENLGSKLVFENTPQGCERYYRIATHHTCIRCGATAITTRCDLFPVAE